MPEISEADYEHWRDHGYVVVKVLDDDQLEAALDNIYRYMPSWDDFDRDRHRYDQLIPRRAFPFVGDALNGVAINPTLLAFAERVLGTKRIMLGHSVLIGKYAGTADYEQKLHVDYQNNTLAYPRPDTAIYDLPVITYYTDVTVELGPTYLVPQEHTRGRILAPARFSRDEAPEFYEHELPVTLAAGSTLIYSMNTWHRGSAMRAEKGSRYSHHVTFTRSDMTWAGQVTFQHEGGRPEMDHFLQTATPRQRELVGFPPVGDPYWDEVTLAGVAARYPAMDMEPYQAGRAAG
jgi:hypothetical protein